MVKMIAEKSFANSRIQGPRDGGAVLAGDEFETDWLHARELVTIGLAKAADVEDLAKEPTEDLEAHNQLSVTEHAMINSRRSKVRGDKPTDIAPVALARN